MYNKRNFLYTKNGKIYFDSCMKKPVKKTLRTKSKVQTVTTRQILTATFALLVANGFALATLPAKNVGIAPVANCPIRLTKSYFCQVKKGVSGYRQYTYTCPSGKSVQVSGACRTQDSVLAMAAKVCRETKSCVAPKAAMRVGTPTVSKLQNPALVAPKAISVQPGAFTKTISAAPSPAPYSDIAFMGRPEENITLSIDNANNYDVTVEYINRGPGDLQISDNEMQRSKILLTLLDKNQQPIFFEPESFMPVIAKGQHMKTDFRLSSDSIQKITSGEAQFVKVELKVGERKIGDIGAFDPDIENNVTIAPLSSFAILK
jgi:hypothetical protein